MIRCLSSASLQRSVCTGGTNPVSSSLATVLSSGDKVTVSRCLPWWCSSKGGKEPVDKRTFDTEMLNLGVGPSFLSPGHGSR